MSEYMQAGQDLVDLATSAARHATAWQARDVRTREGETDAYAELSRAVGALERLVSAAEALRGPLAEALVARRTDQADQLGDLYAGLEGREYGINPEGGPR